MHSPAKILYFDIETAPSLGWVWAKYETNVIDFHTHWYVLSFSYKWQGQRTPTTLALSDFARFKYDREDDKALCKELWKVLDAADIVIAHNGDRFDIRKANARFLVHGLKPPAPYKSIDTLKIARRHFQFDSNKLGDLGKYLGVGHKVVTTGANLWFKCMSGDAKSWHLMKKYNARDVSLLEQVYLKLRPWYTNHPDLDMWTRKGNCPTCESSNVTGQGYKLTKTGKRRQFKCLDCGAWHQGKIFVREKS